MNPSVSAVDLPQPVGLSLREALDRLPAGERDALVGVAERLDKWKRRGQSDWRVLVDRQEADALVELCQRSSRPMLLAAVAHIDVAVQDLARRAAEPPPDRWLEVSWSTSNVLLGLLMALAEEGGQELVGTLGMSARELDDLAERIQAVDGTHEHLLQIAVNAREAEALADAFAACYQLIPDDLAETLIGHDMDEIRQAESHVRLAATTARPITPQQA